MGQRCRNRRCTTKEPAAPAKRIFELRRAGKQWPEFAAELGGQTGPEALRKRYERALAEIAREMAPEDAS